MGVEPETLGEQLATALKRLDVSQSELARRLARADAGTKPGSKRRWLLKLLADELDDPEQESLDQIEAALGESVFTDVERAKESRRRNLARLRAEFDDERQRFDEFAEGVLGRLADLEAGRQPKGRRSGRPPDGERRP